MSMAAYLKHPATAIWALLFGATCLSWFLGGYSADNPALGAIGIIAIALVKIRFIIMNFMEIRHAPSLWRWIFETWLLVTGTAMIALYLWPA
jgi:hypothetical protein